jgi:hypothetical protein
VLLSRRVGSGRRIRGSGVGVCGLPVRTGADTGDATDRAELLHLGDDIDLASEGEGSFGEPKGGNNERSVDDDEAACVEAGDRIDLVLAPVDEVEADGFGVIQNFGERVEYWTAQSPPAEPDTGAGAGWAAYLTEYCFSWIEKEPRAAAARRTTHTAKATS